MKKIVLIFMALVSVSLVNAQDKSAPKSFVAITGGYAALTGNLPKSNYADAKSGYANASGFNIGLEGAWYFSKNFGIGGVVSQSTFYTHNVQSLADGYKDDFDVDSTTVKVSGKYRFTNVMVGPYFSLPVHRFTFDFRAVAGLSRGQTPQFTTYLEDQDKATFSQNAARASALAFQAGAGVRYSVFRNIGIKLAADYFTTRPNFSLTNENRPNNAGRLITAYHQPISMFTMNIGVVVGL